MDTDTLERVDIDVTIETEKGPECQLTHPGCTVTAVALGHPKCSDAPVAFICQKVIDIYEEAIRIGGLCGDCEQPVQKCWTIVLI